MSEGPVFVDEITHQPIVRPLSFRDPTKIAGAILVGRHYFACVQAAELVHSGVGLVSDLIEKVYLRQVYSEFLLVPRVPVGHFLSLTFQEHFPLVLDTLPVVDDIGLKFFSLLPQQLHNFLKAQVFLHHKLLLRRSACAGVLAQHQTIIRTALSGCDLFIC